MELRTRKEDTVTERYGEWRSDLEPGGSEGMAADSTTAYDLSNPIINSAVRPPAQPFRDRPQGPTGALLAGRRSSESFIPIPVSRKGRRGTKTQQEAPRSRPHR